MGQTVKSDSGFVNLARPEGLSRQMYKPLSNDDIEIKICHLRKLKVERRN